jgi:hypothetical protein
MVDHHCCKATSEDACNEMMITGGLCMDIVEVGVLVSCKLVLIKE